ncbi:1200_t:CDS:2, partial [Entrophospora sp. SA101]
MGLLVLPVDRKRVSLPIYKPSDHTPPVYKDPCSGRLIPTAYFLKNLDELGPQHWQSNLTSDFLLRVISTSEIDLYCNYFNRSNNNNNGNNAIINCSDLNINALQAAKITNYFNVMLYNYQHNIIDSSSSLLSPPITPMDDSFPLSSSSSSSSQQQQRQQQSSRYFWSHTLVLALQSGFFNQLLGPLNTIGERQKLPNILTVPIPYPDEFEPIIHWLYHHDDDAWLDLITIDNFHKFYANIKFLKLGKEAYDVLDTFIEEAEEIGLDISTN